MFRGTFATCLLYPPAIVVVIWSVVVLVTAAKRIFRAGDKTGAIVLVLAQILPLSDVTIGNLYGGLVVAALFGFLAWRAWLKRPRQASAGKWAGVALAMISWTAAAFYELDNAHQSHAWRFDLILFAPLLWASSVLAVLVLQRWIAPAAPVLGGRISKQL